MYLDEQFAFGGGHNGPSCRACKRPILEGEHSTRVAFDSDPGLTGDYHLACGKPFASLARAIAMMSRRL